MLRKFFVALCLCGFVVSLSACSAGHGNEVKKGDEQEKKAHMERAKEDPKGAVGLAGPDE